MLKAPIGVWATTTCPNGELSMLRGASTLRIRFRTRPLAVSSATTCDSRSAVASATIEGRGFSLAPLSARTEGSRDSAIGAAIAVTRNRRLSMVGVRAPERERSAGAKEEGRG